MPVPYTSPRYCIYCGRSGNDVRLTEEHINPAGLGGKLKLPGASCDTCSAMTCKFENECIRCMFYAAKGQFGIKGRRSNRAPSYLPLGLERNAKMELYKLHVTQHPSMIFTFDFQQSGIESGASPSEDFENGALCLTPLVDNLMARINAVGGQMNLTFPGGFTAKGFSRMIAKICHAYAVAELGLENFEPVLVDGILGRPASRLRYFVGSAPHSAEPMARSELHEIGFVPRTPGYLTVRLRLFARVATPIYYVVVGTPRMARQIA